MLEFVDHHALEDVCLFILLLVLGVDGGVFWGKGWRYLIIYIMKNVFPKGVENLGGHEEPADAHPETVGEGDEGEGDDEVGEDGGHEDDEGFGGYEVEEEPHYPGEEGGGGGVEVGEPVGDYGEEEGD